MKECQSRTIHPATLKTRTVLRIRKMELEMALVIVTILEDSSKMLPIKLIRNYQLIT